MNLFKQTFQNYDLSSNMSVNDAKQIALLINNIEILESAIECIEDCDEDRYATNIAWIIFHVDMKNIVTSNIIKRISNIAIKTKNVSIRRLCLASIADFEINLDEFGTELLDFCLEKILCYSEPVGVRAVCMKIAYKQCEKIPELKAELLHTFEILKECEYNMQPAISSQLWQIMKKIKY